MDNLETLRNKIDEIDKEMALLFTKRMEVVNAIKEIKKENNIAIVNKEREKAILDKNIKYVKEDYQDSYKEFLNSVLTISKEYQNK